MAPAGRARRIGITGRLAVLLVGVAVVAAAMVAGVEAVIAQRTISDVRAATAHAAAAKLTEAAERAYLKAGGWSGADFADVRSVAAAVDSGAAFTDTTGRFVLVIPPVGGELVTIRQPVLVAGQPVGGAVLTVSNALQPSDERSLAARLFAAVLIGCAAAVVAALLLGPLLARRVARPLAQLAQAAARVGAGSDPHPLPASEVPEISALSRGIETMHEDLVNSARWRSDLLADVAHELRTPLAVLQAELEALADGVREPTPDALNSLHDEVTRLAHLLGDLQSLASAESASLALHLETVDLASLATQAQQAHADTAARAGVRLSLAADSAMVRADPLRLRQIVDNLLSNAIKYTPSGGSATVEVRPLGHGSLLRISDTGRGVPDDEQAHVFTRFYRSDISRDRAGTGVGLAVVARLVAAHHGTVDLTSVLGTGTTVSVWFPSGP